jgi:thiamine pyrophosphate-dependent acetolactate synthase large subunit-like protein
MKRDEVLSVIATIARKYDAFIFVGNAYNARAMCALADQPNVFYMIGSMGLCPTLAAGFSHCEQLPVIAIEGDGNALMGLSGFPVASNAAEGPFVHVVLDNGLYETTGGQQTLSTKVDFVEIASVSGYDHSYHPINLETLAFRLEVALQEKARTFMCASTEVSAGITYPRVRYHPQHITQRFREAVTLELNSWIEG